MLRAILWIIKFVLYTIYLIVPLIKVIILDKKNKFVEKANFLKKASTNWSNSLIRWSGSTVTVIGNENIPKEGGFLIVSNHQSNMDIPILMANINRTKGFVAKLELKKMPIINHWMKYIGCVSMDRNDVRQSLKVINEGAEMMRNGHVLVIFPEGTRSKDGNIGEFKSGSLKLAMKAKVPIIPITLIGSGNIMPKGKFEVIPSNVKIIVSKPIKLDELENKDSNSLTELVRNIIVHNLENNSSVTQNINKCC